MDIIAMLSALGGFVTGGGLFALVTIRFARRQAKNKTIIEECEGLRKIIAGLYAEISTMETRLKECAVMSELVCKECTYKQFYLKMERKRNESINAKSSV